MCILERVCLAVERCFLSNDLEFLKTGRDVPIDHVSLCLGGDDCSCTSSCRYIGKSSICTQLQPYHCELTHSLYHVMS